MVSLHVCYIYKNFIDLKRPSLTLQKKKIKKKIFIRSASEFSHESEKLNMDDSNVRDWDTLFQLTFLILKKTFLGDGTKFQ
jgi:hypothetical protein